MSETRLRMGTTEWLLLGILSVLWGGSFVFVEIALVELPPLTIVLARLALAALGLAIYLSASGIAIPRGLGLWTALAAMGLLNNLVPFSLIALGQAEIGAGLASILVATAPLFSMAAAQLGTKDEKITAGKLWGGGLGVAGVAILAGPAAFGAADVPPLAMLACFGAALSYALAGVYERRFAAWGVAPPGVAFGQAVTAAALLLPLVAGWERPWNLAMPGAGTFAALAALGLLSSALAYALFFRVLAAGGVTNASLVTLTMPVVAVAAGVLWLGESPTAHHLIGMAAIGAGILAVDGRVARLAGSIRLR